jgi:hypothetical protein
VSLRVPLGAHGVANTPHGGVRNIATHASFHVFIRSFTKASIQRCVALLTTVVGNPTVNHSIGTPDHVAALSHSGATITLVFFKKKVVTHDTFAISFEMTCTFSLRIRI